MIRPPGQSGACPCVRIGRAAAFIRSVLSSCRRELLVQVDERYALDAFSQGEPFGAALHHEAPEQPASNAIGVSAVAVPERVRVRTPGGSRPFPHEC